MLKEFPDEKKLLNIGYELCSSTGIWRILLENYLGKKAQFSTSLISILRPASQNKRFSAGLLFAIAREYARQPIVLFTVLIHLQMLEIYVSNSLTLSNKKQIEPIEACELFQWQLGCLLYYFGIDTAYQKIKKEDVIEKAKFLVACIGKHIEKIKQLIDDKKANAVAEVIFTPVQEYMLVLMCEEGKSEQPNLKQLQSHNFLIGFIKCIGINDLNNSLQELNNFMKSSIETAESLTLAKFQQQLLKNITNLLLKHQQPKLVQSMYEIVMEAYAARDLMLSRKSWDSRPFTFYEKKIIDTYPGNYPQLQLDCNEYVKLLQGIANPFIKILTDIIEKIKNLYLDFPRRSLREKFSVEGLNEFQETCLDVIYQQHANNIRELLHEFIKNLESCKDKPYLLLKEGTPLRNYLDYIFEKLKMNIAKDEDIEVANELNSLKSDIIYALENFNQASEKITKRQVEEVCNKFKDYFALAHNKMKEREKRIKKANADPSKLVTVREALNTGDILVNIIKMQGTDLASIIKQSSVNKFWRASAQHPIIWQQFFSPEQKKCFVNTDFKMRLVATYKVSDKEMELACLFLSTQVSKIYSLERTDTINKYYFRYRAKCELSATSKYITAKELKQHALFELLNRLSERSQEIILTIAELNDLIFCTLDSVDDIVTKVALDHQNLFIVFTFFAAHCENYPAIAQLTAKLLTAIRDTIQTCDNIERMKKPIDNLLPSELSSLYCAFDDGNHEKLIKFKQIINNIVNAKIVQGLGNASEGEQTIIFDFQFILINLPELKKAFLHIISRMEIPTGIMHLTKQSQQSLVEFRTYLVSQIRLLREGLSVADRKEIITLCRQLTSAVMPTVKQCNELLGKITYCEEEIEIDRFVRLIVIVDLISKKYTSYSDTDKETFFNNILPTALREAANEVIFQRCSKIFSFLVNFDDALKLLLDLDKYLGSDHDCIFVVEDALLGQIYEILQNLCIDDRAKINLTYKNGLQTLQKFLIMLYKDELADEEKLKDDELFCLIKDILGSEQSIQSEQTYVSQSRP